MIDTVLPWVFTTYASEPLGLMAMAWGKFPTVIVWETVLVEVLMTETV